MRYVWAMVAFLTLSLPVALVSPLVIRTIIDDAVVRSSTDGLLFWSCVLFLLATLSALLGLGVGYVTTVFRTRVIHDLRLRLYRKMQSLSLEYYRSHETGQMMSRQTDDVGQLSGILADRLARIVIDAIKACGCAAMLLYVEWRLAVAGVGLALLIIVMQFAFSRKLRDCNRRSRERWTDVSQSIHESITGNFLIKATASERREAVRFASVLHQSIRADVRRDIFGLWTNHSTSLLAGVAPVVVIIGGVYLIVSGGLTIGGLFAFFVLLVQMFNAVSGVAHSNPAIQRGLASLERIFEVLDTEPEIPNGTHGVRPDRLLGAVTFRDLSFGYVADQPVLRNIAFEVPARGRIALVGPSGAGKSSLMHLIPRFFEPQLGSIEVDGRDIRELDLAWYRRQIGLVAQDVFLFSRSIGENISYGRPSASRDEMERAAKAAHVMEFVEELPDGFDTLIGERGIRLSVGQRQRIAIAREILRDPAILILDEATSSLDSNSEALIGEALERLLPGRTSFVIAHRLSTVVRSDLILVIDKGCIVESGRHNELLASGGLYASFVQSQRLLGS
ncbi:MAG: ABC transporter ATP-binding protein [Planctomycetota bacterium]